MASFFRRITENWKLKTLAFAIAVLLWVVVSAEQVTSNWIPIPLEVQVTDPRYRALPNDVREVQVRFTGAGRDLLDVAVRRPPLRLTIAQVDDLTADYELSPRMVQLPGQLAVNPLDVRPGSVRLSFERLESRVVPVRARYTDSMGSDWTIVDSLRVDPPQVRVTGSPERVAAVTQVYTEPLSLTPADTVFDKPARLDTTGLGGVEVPPGVRVSGRLDRVAERIVQNVPVQVGPGVAVAPDRVEVRLRGAERTVRALAADLIRVVVAVDSLPANIPPEGIAVPLRVERSYPGLTTAVVPETVRLLPAAAAPDSSDGASAAPAPQDLPPDGA